MDGRLQLHRDYRYVRTSSPDASWSWRQNSAPGEARPTYSADLRVVRLGGRSSNKRSRYLEFPVGTFRDVS